MNLFADDNFVYVNKTMKTLQKDPVLIEKVCICQRGIMCYGAWKEFSDEGWKCVTVSKLLQRICKTDKHRGRPHSACAYENIEKAEELILSQDKQKRTDQLVGSHVK